MSNTFFTAISLFSKNLSTSLQFSYHLSQSGFVVYIESVAKRWAVIFYLMKAEDFSIAWSILQFQLLLSALLLYHSLKISTLTVLYILSAILPSDHFSHIIIFYVFEIMHKLLFFAMLKVRIYLISDLDPEGKFC